MATQYVGDNGTEHAVGDAVPAQRLWVPADGGICAAEESAINHGFSRRTALRVGAVGAAGVAPTAGRSLIEP